MSWSCFTGRLWSHGDFLKLWTGQSISEFGSQVSQLAIPWLAAVGLHASPIEFSLLGVLGFLPFILFAMPAGVWVDRLRRRPILIASDTARAILLMLIPILWAAGALRIWHLLALQFLIGGFTVFFDVSYQAYLPALVEREDLVDGNSKMYLSSSVAQVAGPSTAGGLIAAITAPYAILVDALSFVVSAVCMVRIHHVEVLPQRDAGVAHPKMWPQVKEGLAWVIGNRQLRAIAACGANFNLCFNVVLATSSSTPRATYTCRRSKSAQSSPSGRPAPYAQRCSPTGFKRRSASARRWFRPQSSSRPARSLSLWRRDRSRFLS